MAATPATPTKTAARALVVLGGEIDSPTASGAKPPTRRGAGPSSLPCRPAVADDGPALCISPLDTDEASDPDKAMTTLHLASSSGLEKGEQLFGALMPLFFPGKATAGTAAALPTTVRSRKRPRAESRGHTGPGGGSDTCGPGQDAAAAAPSASSARPALDPHDETEASPPRPAKRSRLDGGSGGGMVSQRLRERTRRALDELVSATHALAQEAAPTTLAPLMAMTHGQAMGCRSHILTMLNTRTGAES